MGSRRAHPTRTTAVEETSWGTGTAAGSLRGCQRLSGGRKRSKLGSQPRYHGWGSFEAVAVGQCRKIRHLPESAGFVPPPPPTPAAKQRISLFRRFFLRQSDARNALPSGVVLGVVCARNLVCSTSVWSLRSLPRACRPTTGVGRTRRREVLTGPPRGRRSYGCGAPWLCSVRLF
jgi:hypothetical protein